jgi:transposase-like protein
VRCLCPASSEVRRYNPYYMPDMAQTLAMRLTTTPPAWSSEERLGAVILDCFQEAGERLRQPDLADERLAGAIAHELRAEYVAQHEPPITAELVSGLLIAPMLRLPAPWIEPESEAALARRLGIPRSTLQRWRADYSDGPISLDDPAFLDAMALRVQERYVRQARRAYLEEQGRSGRAAYWWERRHRGRDVRTAPLPRRRRSTA